MLHEVKGYYDWPYMIIHEVIASWSHLLGFVATNMVYMRRSYSIKWFANSGTGM